MNAVVAVRTSHAWAALKVGCCVTALLVRFPGVRVELVDADPERAAVAAAFGVGFALPADAAAGRDLVVHASGAPAGLRRSLELLAPEGTVVELSWYGDRDVQLSLMADGQQNGGWLPRWPLAAGDTNVMTGDPATPFLTDAATHAEVASP